MVATSLIGTCPHAISVEVSHKSLNDKLMSQLSNDISRYLQGQQSPRLCVVYEVKELLGKNELSSAAIARLRNFQKSEHGFTPILVGDNAYKKHTDYLGFKAHKVHEIRLY